MADARRRTTSRRSLAQEEHFEEISSDVGELDEEALERALEDDPDATLALLDGEKEEQNNNKKKSSERKEI